MTHMLSTATARLVLTGALAAAALSGCGQSDGSGSADSATEPAASASSSASAEGTPGPGDSSSATGGEGDTSTQGDTSTGGGAVLMAGEVASTSTVRIVSASNADGEMTPQPVPLMDAAAVREFVAPFGADLGPQVKAAVRETDIPDGQTLMGAVVAIGCDKPTAIELTQDFEGYEVTAILPKSGVQCLVPVTSVALFLVESP